MITGEIYKWASDQAAGYVSREKYHIYLGEGDWKYQGRVFLFVNSSNAHGEGYRITNPPYTCFSLAECFVSCGGIVAYPDQLIAAITPSYQGRLSDEHLAELREAVLSSYTMPQDAINLVCSCLDRHLAKVRVAALGKK